MFLSSSKNQFAAEDYRQALVQAAARYHKLALVVGRPGSGKSAVLKEISQEEKIPILNLGLVLSQNLLNLTVNERKLNAYDLVAETLDVCEGSRLAVDNTEIIFDPCLMLNPQGLLQNVSRTRLLIWSWNGEINADGYITYAFPGHPEYQRISSDEMTLITL
jgi:hypothetical protein